MGRWVGYSHNNWARVMGDGSTPYKERGCKQPGRRRIGGKKLRRWNLREFVTD